MSNRVELEKQYNPKAVEGEMYALWQRHDAFRAVPDNRPREQRYCIVIPPPNVTGALHLGHALNETPQDILIRWHRMRGFNTLWQPGTDHAGIATQAVVERTIREAEGKTRHELGREELVRRIWEWKEQYEARILSQLKLMGCSCDWSRTRFTFDEGCSRAVQETFFRWFKAGLIYRGKRLVNWDTALQTAVADDEVYHETVKGHLTHIRYPISDFRFPISDFKNAVASGAARMGEHYLVVATTRPETMLGDTAVAVHPDDPRYKHLIGRKCLLPLMNREIPIIGDPILVDMQFGTGCVKVTPAHDPNDYQCGLRHGLAMINILTPDGRINEHGGAYAGMPRDAARAKVVENLQALGLIEKIEEYSRDVGHSDRSKTPIEPYLSDQWFVRMGDVEGGITLGDGRKASGLAQAAMDAVIDGRVKIVPERYAKSYLDWLGEKRDWCISRQLWWGHRIPVWSRTFELTEQNWTDHILSTGVDSLLEGRWGDGLVVRVERLRDGAVIDNWKAAFFPVVKQTEGAYTFYVCYVGDDATVQGLLSDAGFVQDEDVLDTWFSSQLWPSSTLGWPDDTPELRYYYPTSSLVTSRDIITLWVARMVISGLYNLGEAPFREVYIHPKFLDARGETMSKSKGNGVDPIDIINVYGADALRYTLADMMTETQDVRMPVEYLCPHCGALTPQTSVVPRNKQPAEVKKVPCRSCKKPFATVWADEALKRELGVAHDTSEKFEMGRNFCNKLWNAARYAFANLANTPHEPLDINMLPTEDRWILARLTQTIVDYQACLSRYRFSAAVKTARDFFWDSLCDWYIELTKPRLQSEIGNRKSEINPQSTRSSPAAAGNPQSSLCSAEAKQVLAFCLDQVLRLLHPIIPFITERLWQELIAIVPQRGLRGAAEPGASDLLIRAEFPPLDGWPKLADPAILAVFEDLQAATRGIRDLRSRCNVPPREKVTVTFKAPPERIAALREQAHIIEHLANVGRLSIDAAATRPKNAGSAHVGPLHIIVHDISDDARELKRVTTELADTEKQLVAKRAKLANEKFVANADSQVVQDERDRLAELETRMSTLRESLMELTDGESSP